MPSSREPDSSHPSVPRVTIVVVDDDAQVCTMLARYLALEGFSVETCASAEAFWPVFQARAPRIVILDLNLPGEDGFSVARRLRERSGVGIIMLTNKGDMVDRVVGLEVGADDYVPKPFQLRELLARLRSLLRRVPAGPDQQTAAPHPVACFSGWRLDLERRELVSPSGDLVPITTKEFQILELLISRPHRPVSRDSILEHTDGREHHPMDRSVDVLIYQLRAKIEKVPGTPRILKTVRGTGYILAADVEMRPRTSAV